MSVRCLHDVDLHDRLLWTTIIPVVVGMCFLWVTYAVAGYKTHRPLASMHNIITRFKYVLLALLITFLEAAPWCIIYSPVCVLGEGKRYLRAGYTIECDFPPSMEPNVSSGPSGLLLPLGDTSFI